MLTPPTKGFARSVNEHNVDLDALAEWLEGCITFVDDVISKTDVKDILHEDTYYAEQDMAQERIDDAWNELRRRQRCLGSCGAYRVEKKRLVALADGWRAAPAYSFCLMLALQVPYRSAFIDHFGTDYTAQGLLFERLTAESMSVVGWSTHSTGWSRAASNSIRDRVSALAVHLGEPASVGGVERWTEQYIKDGGLDVVCHLPFNDGLAGRPLCLLQCASGENWKEKRHTPILSLWTKLIDMATGPYRGISHPFVLLEDDFRRAANVDQLSLVLDRHRVSCPRDGVARNWVSATLADDLVEWTDGRLTALLEHEC